MNTQKKTISSIIVKSVLSIFIITVIECLALTMVAMIPKNNIKQHMEESSDILLERSVFFYMNENDYASRIDRYADSILLNIAYSYNNKQPLKSVMQSAYYYDSTRNENENLKTTVTEHTQPNKDYIRYWHGSNIIVRPLLLFTNVNGIYTLNAIFIVSLLLITLIHLWKRINKAAATCMLISCIATSIWYVPFSLEYTWNIIIMFIASISSTYIYKKSSNALICFFIIIGNITAYFDFLSTETLTFAVPIICLLLLKHKENPLYNKTDYLKSTFHCGTSWLTGYISAWLMKWTIASIVLQTNVFQVALQQANTRISGDTANLSFVKQTIATLTRNIVCVFPFSYMQEHALLATFITVGIIGIFYYLFKKQQNADLSTILFLIAMIPYVRFILISNHSYLHYFFTYRAQLTSIFAVGLAIIYGIDKTLLKKEWDKLWKHKKKS